MKLTDKQKLEVKMLHLAQAELWSISRSGLIANVSALYPETAVDDGLDLLEYFKRLEKARIPGNICLKDQHFLISNESKANLTYCHSFNEI